MKIIAPIDSSDSAESTLSALVGTKWQAGTEIKLLSVKHQEHSKGSHSEDTINIESVLTNKADELKKRLQDCTISTEIAQGDPKTQIAEVAKHWPSDLIVMGTRGKKGLDAIFLGSVSQGVLLQAHCPVIIAKKAPDEQHAHEGFKSIVLSVDNSAYARAALTWLMNINWGENTVFKLVTAIPPLAEFFSGEMNPVLVSGLVEEHKSLFEKATRELQEMAKKLTEATGPGRVSTAIVDGDPREVILNVALSCNADLIVMGSHGKTGLTRLLLGSVSRAISQQAPCAVAVIKGLVPKGQPNTLQRTGRFSG